MPGGRRPIVSTESLILLSNSDDSKFCSFSMKPLARRVTTLSRRRFGSMFLPCWPLISFWCMTLTDSGHGQQLHQPDGQGHLYCWGKPFSIFFRFFFFGKEKHWKNGKRYDHHPVSLQFIHFVQEERSGCQAVAVSAVALLLSATHFA